MKWLFRAGLVTPAERLLVVLAVVVTAALAPQCGGPLAGLLGVAPPVDVSKPFAS